MSNTDEARVKELSEAVRQLAGQIGPADYLPKEGDAANYDFQVQSGLATAVAHILNRDLDELITWFGYCLIEVGIELPDARIAALLDALRREAESQLGEDDDDSENQGSTP
jgi:hypothetical protein